MQSINEYYDLGRTRKDLIKAIAQNDYISFETWKESKKRYKEEEYENDLEA